jgi:hypothetical protein
MALGGRLFIKINNNQIEDGFDLRDGEETRLGWNVWGMVACLGSQIGATKK